MLIRERDLNMKEYIRETSLCVYDWGAHSRVELSRVELSRVELSRKQVHRMYS